MSAQTSAPRSSYAAIRAHACCCAAAVNAACLPASAPSLPTQGNQAAGDVHLLSGRQRGVVGGIVQRERGRAAAGRVVQRRVEGWEGRRRRTRAAGRRAERARDLPGGAGRADGRPRPGCICACSQRRYRVGGSSMLSLSTPLSLLQCTRSVRVNMFP
jgi:hypothetical protein